MFNNLFKFESDETKCRKLIGKTISVTYDNPWKSPIMINVLEIENNSSQGFVRAFVEPAAHPERFLHFLVLLLEPNNHEKDGQDSSQENLVPDTSLLGLPRDGVAKSYAMRANNAALGNTVSTNAVNNTSAKVRNQQVQDARNVSPNSQRNTRPNAEQKASSKLGHQQAQAIRKEVP